MMSSVSPLHPIGKLVNPSTSGNIYGLGSSNVEETVPSSIVNCVGVNLSPSSSSSTTPTSSSSSFLSTNSIVNLTNCSIPSPLPQPQPSQGLTIVSNNNSFKASVKGPGKVNVPYSWKREKINGQIVYISPSSCFLCSHQEISVYLLTDGTCKCGLECPIILEEVFNFDPKIPSISSTLIGKEKPSLCKPESLHNLTCRGDFYNNIPVNVEYPPKTCNHRRRNVTSNADYLTEGFLSNVHDTHNETNVSLTQPQSSIKEATNLQLAQQSFTSSNHVHPPPIFHQHHLHYQQQHQQQQQQQPLVFNSIPVYRSSLQQSIISPSVTIYKSSVNYNLGDKKTATYTVTDDSQTTNLPKDYHHQHPHQANSSPLHTGSYLNWLPLNAPDENPITAIVNENQPNVQAFTNTSSPSLPGFTDVISGMSLAPTLISPNNPGGGHLLQLYNPVQYTSVPPNAVALLSPARNLNRDGATILIPQLMQSEQPVVLNSSENVSQLEQRTLLPPIRATPFPSLPLQTSYAFQPQHPPDSYSTSSPSSTQSYFTSIITSTCSNNKDSNSDKNHLKAKCKPRAKSKTKTRLPRTRKKENRNNHQNSIADDDTLNQKSDYDMPADEAIDKESDVLDGSSLNENTGNEFGSEEPMDSQDCEYQVDSFTSHSDDDKDDFHYEKIDDSAQSTSQDVNEQLSPQQSSSIRNVGVQSDELTPGSGSPIKIIEAESPETDKGSNTSNHVTSNDLDEEEASNHPDGPPDHSKENLVRNDDIDDRSIDEFLPGESAVNIERESHSVGDNFNEEEEREEEEESGNGIVLDTFNTDGISYTNNDTNNQLSDIYNPEEDEPNMDHRSYNYDDCEEQPITIVNSQCHSQLDINAVIKNGESVVMKAPERPIEGLYERLSMNKTTVDAESTENRNNKRLERLRKELLCYENNFDQTTAQSPPLSPQPRTFETGDLVWGQMRGNPSWPGKLINKDDVPGSNVDAEQGKVWVKWFGDNLVTQVELDKLKTLSEGLEAHHTARKKHRKGKKMDSCLDQAIQEAMMELDKQYESPQQQSSSLLTSPTTTKPSTPSPLSSSSSYAPTSSSFFSSS